MCLQPQYLRGRSKKITRLRVASAAKLSLAPHGIHREILSDKKKVKTNRKRRIRRREEKTLLLFNYNV